MAAIESARLVVDPRWTALVPGLFAQAGIAEEVLFRGYLFRHVRAGRTFWRAVGLATLPFVAVHLILFATMPWPIALAAVLLSALIGAPFAYLFELGGGTIWAPALAALHDSGRDQARVARAGRRPAPRDLDGGERGGALPRVPRAAPVTTRPGASHPWPTASTSMLDATRIATSLADRYRVERELGQGGMATVYLAEDVRHRRKVALKVLHPELSAVLGPERFLKEIELTASLQHPHILPLFDSGSADGQLFYVMPFVEGETLRARIDAREPAAGRGGGAPRERSG